MFGGNGRRGSHGLAITASYMRGESAGSAAMPGGVLAGMSEFERGACAPSARPLSAGVAAAGAGGVMWSQLLLRKRSFLR